MGWGLDCKRRELTGKCLPPDPHDTPVTMPPLSAEFFCFLDWRTETEEDPTGALPDLLAAGTINPGSATRENSQPVQGPVVVPELHQLPDRVNMEVEVVLAQTARLQLVFPLKLFVVDVQTSIDIINATVLDSRFPPLPRRKSDSARECRSQPRLLLTPTTWSGRLCSKTLNHHRLLAAHHHQQKHMTRFQTRAQTRLWSLAISPNDREVLAVYAPDRGPQDRREANTPRTAPAIPRSRRRRTCRGPTLSDSPRHKTDSSCGSKTIEAWAFRNSPKPRC